MNSPIDEQKHSRPSEAADAVGSALKSRAAPWEAKCEQWILLLLRAALAQGLVLYLFLAVPGMRPEIILLELVLAAGLSWEGRLRALAKHGPAALPAIAGAEFALAYAAYLTGGIGSPFLPWAVIIWIASLRCLRHARAPLAIACGAALLGVAVAYVMRPIPPEMGPAATTHMFVACPVVALAYLLGGFWIGRRGKDFKGQLAKTAQLERLVNEAELADGRITRFFAEANHAIRTPLNAMIGYSEMILEDDSGAFTTEQLGDMLRIQAATDQLLTLISDVFDLSQIEARRRDVRQNT